MCGCQERSGAGDDESSAPTPFPPAPKYEQELGAFKEWYPLDQRQTTTAKNEWNVCYNMADTHTHRLAFLVQKQADEVKTFHLPNSNPLKVF